VYAEEMKSIRTGRLDIGIFRAEFMKNVSAFGF
jgi:hypothetical protein